MFARLARSSPKASLRLEMTRWICAGMVEDAMLSITAWRFVPLPDIRTVRRIGWEVILGGSGRIEGGWREYQLQECRIHEGENALSQPVPLVAITSPILPYLPQSL